MMESGLDKRRIKNIVQNKINKDPDIFYYINNHKIEKLVDLLVEGIAEAIEANNKEFERDFKRELGKRY